MLFSDSQYFVFLVDVNWIDKNIETFYLFFVHYDIQLFQIYGP